MERTWSVVAGLMACLMLAASTASAHSEIASTTPRAGAVVSSLPRTVTLTFSGRLLGVTRVRVLDARGRDHAASARLDPRDARRVRVRTRNPAAGAYRVRWAVRAEDGHPLSGTFSFRVR
jgi:methionine-rich copper-binding protein CopC